jgi:hypothetical protein
MAHQLSPQVLLVSSTQCYDELIFLSKWGRVTFFPDNFTPFFDEVARKSAHSGENSSTGENELTIAHE